MGKFRFLLSSIAGLAVLTAAGCDTARTAVTPVAADAVVEKDAAPAECHACHGSSDSPAPPNGVKGNTDPSDPGVGAHRVHVMASPDHLAYGCETCHVVPSTPFDPGHMDNPNGRAKLVFGGMALAAGATPTYDYDEKAPTCSNTYCHGAKLKAPGAHTQPQWNKVDGTQRTCGSCHGAPPPAPHPKATECAGCHADTAGPGGRIAKPENHINGKVDVKLGPSVDCAGCHGAPPISDKHPAQDKCSTCHANTVDADRKILSGGLHMNGKIDVVLGVGVNCGGCHGAPPAVAGVDKKPHPQVKECWGCHNTTIDQNLQPIPGGTHMDGKVEVALDAKVNCAGCHGNPPVTYVRQGVTKVHPTDEKCWTCHAATIDSNKQPIVGGKHMNGQVEVLLGPGVDCKGCHAAPPWEYTDKAGVKQPHPQKDACGGCHATTVDENKNPLAGGTHMDGLVQVALGPTTACPNCQADCAGCHAAPPQNYSDKGVLKPHPKQDKCWTCHAASIDAQKHEIPGGKHRDGQVQVLLGPGVDCTGCHSAPPKYYNDNGVQKPHPQQDGCSGCHATTVDDAKNPIPGGTHLDGKVEVVLGSNAVCTGCHEAPPKFYNDKGVQKPHPQQDKCWTCHAASIDSNKQPIPGGKHMDGQVEVVLGPDVNCSGCHEAPPTTAKHPQIYNDKCWLCHSETVDLNKQPIAGGKHMNGQIDVLLPTQGCDQCHGAPPKDAEKGTKPHPAATLCGNCHSTTVSVSGQMVAQGTHANGKVDVLLPTANCYTCHGNQASQGAPAPDVNGKSDPTLKTVGAHAAHLNGKQFSKGGIACSACHALPAAVDAPGHMFGQNTVLFPAGNANLAGLKPNFDQATQTCSSVYCHGGAEIGGALPQPVWTMTDIKCDSCHMLPPPVVMGHVQTDPTLGTKACNQCHSKTVKPDGTLDIQGGYHINGWVDP